MGLHNLLEKQPPSYEKKKAYQFHKLLGTGTFGEVKQATWTKNYEQSRGLHLFAQSNGANSGETQEVAIKCIHKKLVKTKPEVVMDEMNVLKDLNNPHVLKILDWFESKDKYYLVFELVAGGELFERVVKQKCFSEHDAASAIRGTLEGVCYLHQKGICHRDLKPENLLLRDSNNDHLGDIVIADFGVAHHMTHDAEMMKTLVGSPGYSAPELFTQDGYLGMPADIWSIGVITYALISGTTPFKGKDNSTIVKEQIKDKIDFSDKGWAETSKEAKDFIQRCLRVDPKKRMTCEEAINHPWLVNDEARTNHDLGDELRLRLTQSVEDGRATSYRAASRQLTPGEQELSPADSSSEEEIPNRHDDVKALGEKVSAVEV